MVCQAASQTRFRALKHENGIEGEPAIIVRVIACFQPLHDCQAEYFRHLLKPVTSAFRCMVKADSTWPRPLHVAWQSPYFHGSSTVPEPRLCDLPAHLNASTCISPGHNAFTFPAFTNLETKQADGLQGSLQYPNHHQTGDIQDIRAVSELCLKETYCGGDMRNENPASLQKKFLIFDQSGNKTRLLYHPVFPFPQIPFVAPTKFTQPSNEIEEGQATNKGENDPIKCSLPNESDENHVINEESEMHEDTDEINALLYSDEDGDDDYIDDDEVASTGCSPLATKRTYLMQEQFENIKEEVASSDQPNKKRKLIDDKYKRSSPINSSSSVRLNETCEYISDAESKYSSGQTYFAKQPEGEDNSIVGDIQLKKDKIRESLRVLENLVPGAKGKQPLLVIDETIEYLKSFMSQTGTLGLKDI